MTLVCARPHNLVTSESEWIPAIYWIRSGAVDTYQIYDGTDENGIVGTVAPGLFAQEGRCRRMGSMRTQPATVGTAWSRYDVIGSG